MQNNSHVLGKNYYKKLKKLFLRIMKRSAGCYIVKR